jgi:glucose uptake protein
MLLPTTYGATLLALALTALFWGIWANTLRADRKWRFELYAVDFAFGAVAIALILAMTVGNAGTGNSFTFEDNVTVASKRNMATAFGGGVIYCLGNIMLLAGVTLAGMSTALPLGAAMGLLTGVAWTAIGGGPAMPEMVYGGAGAALAAVLMAALAQKAAEAAAPVKKGMHPGWKGFILSCIGGVILGISLPVVESSRVGDIGLGAYGAAVFMTLGLLAMTPLVDLYFLNLPVQGEVASPGAYFKGTLKQHLLGMVGGGLWAAGTTMFFSSVGGTYAGAPAFLGSEALAFGGAVLGALCGLVIWGEQAGAPKAKLMLLGTMILLAGGAAAIFLGA